MPAIAAQGGDGARHLTTTEPKMHPSQDCIDLVKASEGCRLTAYRDSVGVLTIGYGHTNGVKEGQTITQAEADELLAEDLDHAADAVRDLVKVHLSQGQYDALTSFCFNLGQARLRDSTLLRLLNQGQYQQAAAQFKYWVLAAGVKLPGLVKRRESERQLFLSDGK